jgi:hypothetical protein
MNGRDCGYDQRSGLSVFVAPRAAGAGGEEDAPPPPARLASRRARVVDLVDADAGWAPVASSMSGDIVPLGNVLDALLAGLTPSRR